jgi:hypothetical protein
MNTQSQQSLGGSNAGITGQAGLMAARTRNAGAGTAVEDAGSQNAMRQNSENAVGNEVANANLQQKQSQEGLKGLSSLYGTDVNAANQEQQISNQALSNANQVRNPWGTLGLGILGSAAQAGIGSV